MLLRPLVRQVVGQSEEDGAAGFGAQLFHAAARVPERQRGQTAPPAGRRLHLHTVQIAVRPTVLLPGPSQPLSLCAGGYARTCRNDFSPLCALIASHCGCPLILCCQVSWHWKNIVELDQLWMPKCQRLGWCQDFNPNPLEQGVWKRHYIQKVLELRDMSVQVKL